MKTLLFISLFALLVHSYKYTADLRNENFAMIEVPINTYLEVILPHEPGYQWWHTDLTLKKYGLADKLNFRSRDFKKETTTKKGVKLGGYQILNFKTLEMGEGEFYVFKLKEEDGESRELLEGVK